MKFIESIGFHNATLCTILLQGSSVTAGVSPDTIIGYIDKLGTIGLLIYFLWRDKRDSRKREERFEQEKTELETRYDKQKTELETRYQQDVQAKILFFEQQMQKQRDFYESFHPTKNNGTARN